MGNRTEYWRQYKQKHLEHKRELRKAWDKTPQGSAVNLLTNYRRDDRLQERGECTLTSKWIVEHIFSKRCLYCGESDWHFLGADRIDNTKPHTPNNCICCCSKCNAKRGLKDFLEYAYSIGAKDSDCLTIKY